MVLKETPATTSSGMGLGVVTMNQVAAQLRKMGTDKQILEAIKAIEKATAAHRDRESHQ
jgi:hypothetical protein